MRALVLSESPAESVGFSGYGWLMESWRTHEGTVDSD